MKSNWFKIIMKLSKVKYGKKLVLNGIPVIFNNGGNLCIGDNCTIKSGFLSNLVGLYQRTIIVTRNSDAEIIIGDNVGISGATIYARSGIHIGDRTLIGGNTKILDNDFHPIEAEYRREQILGGVTDNVLSHIKSKPIEIGKDCFIGANSIILKGTVIGDGCVVGAGSVVCGKFEPNTVIAGNPAKVIRHLQQ